MKNVLCLFVVILAVSGCASGEIVVQKSVEDVDDTFVNAPEALDAGVDGLQAANFVEGGTGVALVITERFVDWGFTSSDRDNGDIDTVIIHSVYNPFEQKQRHDLDEILAIFEGYGVAPHYIITRDGQVHHTVRDQDIAYHAGRSQVPDGRTGVNDFSLGIELINSLDDEYTTEQYSALRMLLESIRGRYAIKYVLGHDEIAVEDPWSFDWSSINDLRHEARVDE